MLPSTDGPARGERPFAPRRVAKPWGFELIWAETDTYVGKVMHIEAGHQLSYQFHVAKDETVHVLSGAVEIDVGDASGSRQTIRLGCGDSFHIRPGLRHRLRALETSDVLEASTPQLDDVVRIEDDYGRASL
jgi:mannose-6-phosphate isomerase-like protein (cupin superfamily)